MRQLNQGFMDSHRHWRRRVRNIIYLQIRSLLLLLVEWLKLLCHSICWRTWNLTILYLWVLMLFWVL